jgi:hypothetical protein
MEAIGAAAGLSTRANCGFRRQPGRHSFARRFKHLDHATAVTKQGDPLGECM